MRNVVAYLLGLAVVLSPVELARAQSSEPDDRRLRRSHVTIEPLDRNKLDGARLPDELKRDLRSLIHEGIDMPVVQLRCEDKPGAVWTLRLPENGILGTKGVSGYQTKYQWEQDGPNAFSYDWHPITRVEMSRVTNTKMEGRVRARVWVDKDRRVAFEIVYRNDSTEEWVMPATWVCLIHRYAGPGKSYYRSRDRLRPTADVPAKEGVWLKWFAVKGRERFAEACGQWIGGAVDLSPGAAETPELVWRSDEPAGFEVRIGSDQAGLLGWGKWPCTDLGLVGRNLEPGGTRVYRGWLEMGIVDGAATEPPGK